MKVFKSFDNVDSSINGQEITLKALKDAPFYYKVVRDCASLSVDDVEYYKIGKNVWEVVELDIDAENKRVTSEELIKIIKGKDVWAYNIPGRKDSGLEEEVDSKLFSKLSLAFTSCLKKFTPSPWRVDVNNLFKDEVVVSLSTEDIDYEIVFNLYVKDLGKKFELRLVVSVSDDRELTIFYDNKVQTTEDEWESELLHLVEKGFRKIKKFL